jgi:hypothetical protein
MARIEQLDLLNEVVISHDDDDDGKLWFTITVVRHRTSPNCVEWRLRCKFDEAKQIYGIVIGNLQSMCPQDDKPVQRARVLKDVCISLYRGKIKDGSCVPEDSVGGCELLDARNIVNQLFYWQNLSSVFDAQGLNEFDDDEFEAKLDDDDDVSDIAAAPAQGENKRTNTAHIHKRTTHTFAARAHKHCRHTCNTLLSARAHTDEELTHDEALDLMNERCRRIAHDLSEKVHHIHVCPCTPHTQTHESSHTFTCAYLHCCSSSRFGVVQRLHSLLRDRG